MSRPRSTPYRLDIGLSAIVFVVDADIGSPTLTDEKFVTTYDPDR